MLASITLRPLIQFGRRTRADLAGKAVLLTNPHRRRVNRDHTQSFGTSPCHRFNRRRTTEGGRKLPVCLGADKAAKRTFCEAQMNASERPKPKFEPLPAKVGPGWKRH